MFFNRPIALALGGGGARGFAHIGILRVLEREHIKIGSITGTSMGAIIGAMYAQHSETSQVVNRLHNYLHSSHQKDKRSKTDKKDGQRWFDHVATLFRDQVLLKDPKKMTFGLDKLRDSLYYLLDDRRIEDTQIPFSAVATDVLTGEEVILKSGPILRAVAASSALPGVLPPVEYGSHLLIDGAATSAIPVHAAKKMSGHKKVIACDVSADLSSKPRLDNAVDILMRNSRITSQRYRQVIIKEADVLIQPDVGSFHWSHFENIDMFIKEGERAAEQKLSEIKRAARWP